MAHERDRVEIDRLDNMASGFGWTMVEQKFEGDDIVVVLKRKQHPVEGEEAGGPS